MTRIRAQSPEDITFRQGDTPPTRAMKLELLRQWILDQIEDIVGDGTDTNEPDPPEAEDGSGIEKVRAWWAAPPGANQTLIIWSFTEAVTFQADFAGSVGSFGGSLSADAEIEVYRNPTFTGAEITGGELIGTVTIDSATGEYSFATVDSLAYLFEADEHLGAKWPNVTEANAYAGDFVLYGWIGEFSTFNLLLAGDQQSGEDVLLIYGDQAADFNDALLVGGTA